jgi:cytochrome bd ubiquinol oxidase subunit II
MNFILIWAVLISFIILTYVLLDGFDLGIGILFPWVKGPDSRDIVMSTVAPVWDGNETWLVFGAAALYGAFPMAYGILLPILYMPITFMLLALIFRGLAFEFRFKAPRNQRFWDIAFALGSTVVAFMQGMILGCFVQGYGDQLVVGHTYPWITPFSVLTGIAVVAGYGLLGATWLILKTTGALQARFYTLAKYLLGLVSGFLMIVCCWTPLLSPAILERWVSVPNCYYLLGLGGMVTGVIISHFSCLNKRCEKAPFLLSLLLFVGSYIGFCISVFPYIVPRVITFWEAAAPISSLKFTLTGVAIIIPMLIAYTVYAYHVFRGKVTQSIHY